MWHLDLFSGIGGFAYAVDQVWDDVEHIFCEFDPFCQQVLKKHWPESEIINDIRDITDTDFRRSLQRQSEIQPTEKRVKAQLRSTVSSKQGDTNSKLKRLERLKQEKTKRQPRQFSGAGQIQTLRPFILTGGFPCQPFSAAGVRRGTSDERYLWPEMLRVIRLTQPQWVIAENVRGLLTWEDGLVFEQICSDLETEGYEVWPFIIPALAVNAPHRRDRIWWVATNTQYDGQGRTKPKGFRETSEVSKINRQKDGATRELKRTVGNGKVDQSSQNSISQRSRGRSKDSRQVLERQSPKAKASRPNSQTGSFTNSQRFNGRRISSNKQKSQGESIGESPQNYSRNASYSRYQRQTKQKQQTTRHKQYSWSDHWLEVAAELCVVDDGLSNRLVRFPDGEKISQAKWRKESLKAGGNAIVPQVAIEIMKSIKIKESI